VNALTVFGFAFLGRGSAATGVARAFPAGLAALSDELHDRVRDLLDGSANTALVENLIRKALTLNIADTPHTAPPPRRMRVFPFVGDEWTVTDVPAAAAALLRTKRDVLASLLVPEHSETVGRFVTDAAFPRLSSAAPRAASCRGCSSRTGAASSRSWRRATSRCSRARTRRRRSSSAR
jgi:hypothetical protein